MKVLIAYASKTGTVEKCAKILKALVENSELCDLTKEKPELGQYTSIIIGGSIRMGTIHKSVKQFLSRNQETLRNKNCAYFICNCAVDQVKSLFKKNIPEDLLKKAVVTSSFGGEMNIDDQKGIDRLIAKALIKTGVSDNLKTSISSEAMNEFAEKIN